MKRICAVLGLALLMGCGNNNSNDSSGDNDDCPRKDKSCGKGITSAPVEHQEVAQEVVSVVENVTPSK